MESNMLKQIRQAIGTLDPAEVRQQASQRLIIEVIGTTPESYQEMGRFFAPPDISQEKRAEVREIVFKAGEAPGPPTLRVHYEDLPRPAREFTYYRAEPMRMVHEILEQHPELSLVLARHLINFRQPVIDRVTWNVCRENALFSLATAVPSILPFISLPWAIGEFASDTAFLTMNQIRMAFQIAAASDRGVGYREQRAEIASIVAGAFGWRAVARELVGKIPMGGGLIPKAAVAFAGSYVAGVSLDRYYRFGKGMSRRERKAAYQEAYERGKAVAQQLLANIKSQQQQARRA
jgi:hypothetical protein